MLNEPEPTDTSDIWVEVRVDEGNVDQPPRHIVVYVGRVRRELLQEWTRIEHGEYWFALNDVLWYQDEPPAPPVPQPRSGWFSSLLDSPASENQPAEGVARPDYRTLIRQSEKARYWGYGDQLYLRLDRVYRIIPLSQEYVEKAVLPALRVDADQAGAPADAPQAE